MVTVGWPLLWAGLGLLGVLVVLATLQFVRARTAVATARVAATRAESDAAMFHDMVECSPDALILLDATGCFRYFNAKASELFQQDLRAFVGQRLSDVASSATPPGIELLERMRRGETDLGSIDGFVDLPDGSRRWIERNAQAIRGADGALRGVLIASRDAHHRQLAQQRERAQDRQVRFLTERMREMVWATDAEGRVTYASPGSEVLLGWPPSGLVGKRFRELGHPDSLRERARELLAAAHVGEVDDALVEGEMRRRDGTLIWTETTARVERDDSGHVSGLMFVTRDITARRAAEQALRDSEERLRFMTTHSRDVLWTIDGQGYITYVSQSNLRLLGRRPETLVGRHISESVDSPDLVAKGADLFAGAARGEFDSVTFEGQQASETGEQIWVEISAQVIRDAAGRMTSAVLVTRDVDARKKTEAELEHQRVQLQRRTQELAAVVRDLEAFTSMVSHDLQGPLRRIEALASSDAGAPLGPDLAERIRLAAQQGNAIVDGLLDLARYGSGALAHDAFDVSWHATTILAELAESGAGRVVRAHVDPGMAARGDARLLHVALRNLLSNAWKFTRDTNDAAIHVGCQAAADGTEYFVEDNGVGFDPADAERVFKPFVRLTPSGTAGVGLGLATVERIIHRHGGRVRAEGRPGQGSRFSFTLPGDVHDGHALDAPAPAAG